MSSEALRLLKTKPPIPERSGHNPLETPLAFQTPRLISDVSAWIQHIPFAFALMEMLRPRRVVELGTFKGDSYCAFCQAVESLQLETQCTAIDTWRGDPQAGHYDNEVFQTLSAYHNPLYGSFSKLLRSTFDEAAPRFPDGSIDLLHLDGLHHYAAVRRDFDTWRPKLSDQAVVLIHDIDERKGDFGVYQLWEELRPHFPHFEFFHGHGLGILLVGERVPPRLRSFTAAAERTPDAVRRYFQALGQRLELGRGIALLAHDVAQKEARANEWKASRNQAQRDLLPTDLNVNAFIDIAHTDVKFKIDRIHETSINQLDDMKAIATDNRNLSEQLEGLKAVAESLHGLREGRANDVREITSLRGELIALANRVKMLGEEVRRLEEEAARQSVKPLPLTFLQKVRIFLAEISG